MKRYLLFIAFFILSVSVKINGQSRETYYQRAIDSVSVGNYQTAMKLLDVVIDKSKKEDPLLANALVLKFNIAEQLQDTYVQKGSMEQLQACLSGNPSLNASFANTLKDIENRFEINKTSFVDRLCGLWVSLSLSPDYNNLGYPSTFKPMYYMLFYKDGDTYKATTRFAGPLNISNTDDIEINNAERMAKIYDGKHVFQSGDHGIVSGALISSLNSTAQDAHGWLAQKNRYDLYSTSSIAEQVGVSLGTGLLEVLFSELAVAKSTATNSEVDVVEIAPGIIDVNLVQLTLKQRSDGGSKSKDMRGHIRLYKVVPECLDKNTLLNGHSSESNAFLIGPESFSFLSLEDNGIAHIREVGSASSVRKHYPSLKNKESVYRAMTELNLSNTVALQRYYINKYDSEYGWLFKRDFYGVNSLPVSSDITNIADSVSHVLEIAVTFMNCRDYENAIPYFEIYHNKVNVHSVNEYYYLASCYDNVEEYDKALSIYLEGMQQFPDNQDLYVGIINHYFAMKQFDKTCFDYITKAQTTADKNTLPRIKALEAFWLLKNHEYDKSIAIVKMTKQQWTLNAEWKAYLSYISGRCYLEKATSTDNDNIAQTVMCAKQAEEDLRIAYSASHRKPFKETIESFLIKTYECLLKSDLSNSEYYKKKLNNLRGI